MKDDALQFPIGLFPKVFQDIARDCEISGGFPVSFTASSMLLAVATAIGNSRSLSCPMGISSSCALFMALLGSPGAVKTPSMAFAMQPLRERDDETLTEYASLLKEYRASLRSGEQVEKPTPRQLITDDITIESLAHVPALGAKGMDRVASNALHGTYETGKGLIAHISNVARIAQILYPDNYRVQGNSWSGKSALSEEQRRQLRELERSGAANASLEDTTYVEFLG